MAETKPMPNQKLRYERERRGWSQQDVADQVGTTPLNVGRWERGVNVPGPYFRQKLSEVFEKTLQELDLVPTSADAEKAIETPSSPSVMPAAQDVPASVWNVPYNRNLLFTGREDILSQLREALSGEESPVALTQPQAISGLGGIGKTQTAVEYAYRYRQSYEAVLWARADSADLLRSDFLTIAALLNLPQRNEQEQSLVVKAVLNWFDTHEGWLLILDNADHLETVSEFIPSAGKGHVLLTTRAHSTGTIAQRLEIEKMGTDEGIVLLLRRMKRLKGSAGLESIPESMRKQAQAIVEALDGLPLALDQAGAYIEETGCSLSDYLKFYQSRRKRLLRTRGQSATGHPEPVATTWSLAFEKVEQANPAAAELLRLCAFLHPDEIPEAMMIEGAAELGAILQPVAEDEMELNEAIGELRKYSLIKRDPEKKILNMHRLVQAVIKDGMDKDEERRWAERVVRMVNRAFPDFKTIDNAEIWPKCQYYLPHASLGTELIEQWSIVAIDAAQLLAHIACYLRCQGLYIQAERLHRRALHIAEQVLGPSSHEVADILNDLALVYWGMAKYEEVEPLLQHALLIEEQTQERPADIAEIINNLGILYHMQGKYTQAEPLYQRAISLKEQTLGPRDPALTSTLNNLALLYKLQGKRTLVEPLFQRALAIAEQAFGSNHPDVAMYVSQLGSLYWEKGEYEQAEVYQLQAIEIFEQTVGPEHFYVATSLNELGLLYRDQNKYEQAEPFLQRALTIREKILGPDHHDTARSLHNLGSLYRKQEKFQQAETLLLRAISITERGLGANHPDLARQLETLASLYDDRGEYEKSIEHFQRALTIREQSLGVEHPTIAPLLETYASLLRKTNRPAEAAELEARAQAIRAKQE